MAAAANIQSHIPHEPAFEPAEFRARLERVRERMAEHGVDVLVLFSPANVFYLSGLDNDNFWEPLALVVTQTEDPVLCLPAFERGRVENTAWVSDVAAWERDDTPLDVILGVVRRTGGRRIGIEQRALMGLTPELFGGLIAGLPDGSVVNPHGIVEWCRQRKSPAELTYMREAGRITDAASEAGLAAIRPGVSDREIAAEIMAGAYRAGSDIICFGPVVAVRYRAGAPHSTMNGTRVAAGDTVFLELTGQRARYAAPSMRSAYVGDPPAWITALADAGEAAVDTVIRLARPGVTLGEVAEEAWRCVEPVADGLFLTGAFGYPMGIGFPPLWLEDIDYFIRRGRTEVFEAGMTFHVAVALRGYGAFGVNQSQSMVVTENGGERLTTTSPRLRIVPA